MTSGQDLDPALFDDPALADLVARAMDIRDGGEALDLAEVCVDHPHLVHAVSASLDTGSQLRSLQRGHAGYDRRKGSVVAERYRLEQRLGAGAMGVVYGATDLDLGRRVAVKILRSGFLESHEAEQRFTREAEAMAAVNHNAVITVYDRGRTEEGEAFLVMERLEGASLGSLLDTATKLADAGQRASTEWVAAALGGDRLDESTFLRAATRWTADLASGLVAAHASGVYHRDVKPSNVFIRRDGTPVLLDFGIAARTDEHTITRDGSAVGTPAYMAPEAFAQDVSPGPSFDVYSLTATLYHLLTDKAPYTGSPSQVIASLITEGPTPAYRLEPAMPRDLQAILDKGMARRVADRYASVTELEADLRAFLAHQPVKARPISKVTRTWRKVRRMPVFWVLLVGSGLALSGLAWRDARLARAARRFEIYHEAERHVPPNLIYGAPGNRILTEAEGKDAVERYIDTMVENRAAALPSLALRTAFRLDHGDVAGAKSDARRMARELESHYATALADRYSALEPGVSGAASVDLTALPEPETADDFLLAAIHALRAEDFATFRAHVQHAELDGVPAATPLRLLLTAAGSPLETYEGLLAYEAQNGGRTAQTAFQVGAMLVKLRRYTEAVAVLGWSLERAPGSFRTLENLGLSKWCLADLDEARAYLQQAIEYKPQYPATHYVLARVLVDQGELELASEVLAQAPKPRTRRSRLWAITLPPEILVERAISLFDAGETEAARDAAAQALAQFESSESQWSKLGDDLLSMVHPRVAIARGLVAEEIDIFGALLDKARLSGLRREALAQSLRFLPEEATPQWRAFIRYLLLEHSPRFERDPFLVRPDGGEPSAPTPR